MKQSLIIHKRQISYMIRGIQAASDVTSLFVSVLAQSLNLYSFPKDVVNSRFCADFNHS